MTTDFRVGARLLAVRKSIDELPLVAALSEVNPYSHYKRAAECATECAARRGHGTVGCCDRYSREMIRVV